MGYCTKFNLEITPEHGEVRGYLSKNEDMCYALGGGDSCKWYDHEADMIQMSREFPDILFELTGEGEEAGDLWRKYFKNEKYKGVLRLSPTTRSTNRNSRRCLPNAGSLPQLD